MFDQPYLGVYCCDCFAFAEDIQAFAMVCAAAKGIAMTLDSRECAAALAKHTIFCILL